ncbi:hypothetical protein FJTKL_01990 [Diaporthe vaccinii]|uniref:Major facilitator superfamily (MFS) profile domain-containing protein n=1 Tax=Diaporthe vaccinii TaxID=105482 RepID=A0ABR4DZ65_9PEZI
MAKELTDLKIELMVSTWPTVHRLSVNYAEMLEHGYLIRVDQYARTFYEGQEKEGQQQIVNLIRCAWAGSQKFGALVWGGDIASSWSSLRNQLAAGLNMGIASIPWWTTDIVGELLCGIPWGVFATMAPAYASEVCPMALRGYLTVYVNLCWELISAGVQAGFSENTTEWSYRIPFAIQCVWPIPLFAILFLAPESPWYYVRAGRYADAEKSVMRLSSTSKAEARKSVAMMVHTGELEKSLAQGTSYLDCFRGVDLRRTEIVCFAFMAQPFCGSAMGGTPTYFFVQAGLPTSISFQMSVGGLSLACLGTVISWWLMHAFGRRTLYLWGLGLLTTVLMIVGFISVGAANSTAGNYAQAAMMLVWLLVYYLTVGPICYAIIGETSSTRLRNKSVCLSRIAYYISQIICNIINPYMLNPTAGDWQGKTGFFWSDCAALFFVWYWFRLPETKNKTFEELDILFARGVKAVDFKKYKVDAYAHGEERQLRRII